MTRDKVSGMVFFRTTTRYLFFSFSDSRLAGLLDLFQIKIDQRGHLRRLPNRLFGILGPSKRKKHNLSGFFGPFQKGENLQQNLPLSLLVSNLTQWPSIRIFNGRRTGNTDSPVKFVSRSNHNGGKTSFFQISGSQSYGLATEGSGRGEERGFHSLGLHLP